MKKQIYEYVNDKMMNDVGKKLGHSQKWLIQADISENGEVGSSIDTHQKEKEKAKPVEPALSKVWKNIKDLWQESK